MTLEKALAYIQDDELSSHAGLDPPAQSC